MARTTPTLTQRNEQIAAIEQAGGRLGRLRIRQSAHECSNAKTRIEFECLDCRAGSEGGWLMQIHNVLYGQGCRGCAALQSITSQFQAQFPGYVIEPCIVMKGPPAPTLTLYQISPAPWELPAQFGWELPKLTHQSVQIALRSFQLPGVDALRKYEGLLATTKAFAAAFKHGTIRFAGESKTGSTSPGPFYCIDTGKRRIRAPVVDEALSAAGILKHCRQEQKDWALDEELHTQAQLHGARILGYEFLGKGGFHIRYVSRTGFMGLDTRWRAREKFWGQSGFRRGETLALVIMAELFPASDWARNTRPAFLLQENGYRLELDGYSPSLKLALEYQGKHHYEPHSESEEDKAQFAEWQARDIFKRKRCADSDVNVKLVEVPDAPLDPDAFLASILAIIREMGLQPGNATPSLDRITARWKDLCANPLKSFQDKFMEGLGIHELLSPELARIGKATTVKYRCGTCTTINEVKAKGIAEGAALQFCANCAAKQMGNRSRALALAKWVEAGVPPEVIAAVEVGEGGRYEYRCDQQHITVLHSMERTLAHVHKGAFACPECHSQRVGIPASHVAQLPRYRESFSRDVQALGLTVEQYLPYREQVMEAEIRCPLGHLHVLDRETVRLMLLNKCLADRQVVPWACPTCCFPGLSFADIVISRSTVFHRLHVLQGMYPKAGYMGGFDHTSLGDEMYTCGALHSDGSPHPPIRISFRNLQKAAEVRPSNHLCGTCGLLAGQVGGRSKTLEDLVAAMWVLRDEIGKTASLPKPLEAPTVEFVSGEISDKNEVSTTKTRLRFWCGVADHSPVEATKDYYFNRAQARGRGFCSRCVDLVGAKKAPLPVPSGPVGALRDYKLRREPTAK